MRSLPITTEYKQLKKTIINMKLAIYYIIIVFLFGIGFWLVRQNKIFGAFIFIVIAIICLEILRNEFILKIKK